MYTYIEYQDIFCRDLGLCNREQSGWGPCNRDPKKVQQIAVYYVQNYKIYDQVGREMLLECLLESFEDKIREDNAAEGDSDKLFEAIALAINDIYDTEVVRSYWSLQEQNPVSDWLHRNFPNWTPPKSIWDE